MFEIIKLFKLCNDDDMFLIYFFLNFYWLFENLRNKGELLINFYLYIFFVVNLIFKIFDNREEVVIGEI